MSQYSVHCKHMTVVLSGAPVAVMTQGYPPPLLPGLLSTCEQFPVAPQSSGADDDLDNSWSLICIHLHVLDGGLFVQPTEDEEACLVWILLHLYTVINSSHLNWGVLRSTLRSKMCFPVQFTILFSTAFLSSSRPRSSKADMGSAPHSADWKLKTDNSKCFNTLS